MRTSSAPFRGGGGRSSGAGVIMGGSGGSSSGSSRPVVPAPFVPEELISQAQVVLQGKSRNLIIRELQVWYSLIKLNCVRKIFEYCGFLKLLFDLEG